MALLSNKTVRAGRWLSEDPANGLLAAINTAGSIVNVQTWDPLTGILTIGAPVGSTSGTGTVNISNPLTISGQVNIVGAQLNVGLAVNADRFMSASAVNGEFGLTSNTAGTNNKNWLIYNDAAGDFIIGAYLDDWSGSVSALTITRSGTATQAWVFGSSDPGGSEKFRFQGGARFNGLTTVLSELITSSAAGVAMVRASGFTLGCYTVSAANGATNAKKWQVLALDNNTQIFRTISDDELTTVYDWLVLTRSATTVTTQVFKSSVSVTLNTPILNLIPAGGGVALLNIGPALTFVAGDALRIRSDSAATGTVDTARIELHHTAAASGTKEVLVLGGYGDHTSGTIDAINGFTSQCFQTAGGTVTWMRAMSSGGLISAGTVTNYGVVVATSPATSGGGTIGTLYGLYVNSMSAGTANWAIWCESSTTSGGVSFRNTALATTATVGFVFHPSMNGTPSGTPSPIPTAGVPFAFDSSGSLKAWAYFPTYGWRYIVFT